MENSKIAALETEYAVAYNEYILSESGSIRQAALKERAERYAAELSALKAAE